MQLTVVICTHNRAHLLERALISLIQANRPLDSTVEVLVVANACTDNTVDLMQRCQRNAAERGTIPLRWIEEHTLGKSHALNRAVALTKSPVMAFVDDDQRVDTDYLVSIEAALQQRPDTNLFCGRLLPDWDGTEPSWIHDTGPYRIYPMPVPCFDQGEELKPIRSDGPIPQGGNLFLRRSVLERLGGFSTALGPQGHDLLGGEDREFILRALHAGERMQYVPYVIQYHHVDLARLRIGHLMRRSYQRSRSMTRMQVRRSRGIPLYMWRKTATYLAKALFSIHWAKTRFNLIRLAATLGEICGLREAGELVDSESSKGSAER